MHTYPLQKVNFMKQTELILQLAKLWTIPHEILVQKLVTGLSENLHNGHHDSFKDVIFNR